MTKTLGSKRIRTTAYHPQSNGLIENFHKTLKTAITSSPYVKNWSEELPIILLALRATINAEAEVSPAEALYGQELRLPGDVFSPNPPHDANENSKRIARATTALQNISHHDSKRHSYFPSSLKTCTHAFIRDDRVKPAFIPPYQGPFKILDRSDKFFTLNLRSKPKAVSVDRLKPCLTFSDIHPQNPLGNKKRVVAQKGTSVFDTTSKTEIEAPRAAPIVSRTGRISKPPVRFGINTIHAI